MIKHEDLCEYLNYEYPYSDDVIGLVEDMLNGITTVDELKAKVIEYTEHNA